MTETKPKIFTFSEAQTRELLQIWEGQRQNLHPDDFLFIKIRLNRPQAKLSINQIYRMTMNLVNGGYESPLPEFLMNILEPN